MPEFRAQWVVEAPRITWATPHGLPFPLACHNRQMCAEFGVLACLRAFVDEYGRTHALTIPLVTRQSKPRLDNTTLEVGPGSWVFPHRCKPGALNTSVTPRSKCNLCGLMLALLGTVTFHKTYHPGMIANTRKALIFRVKEKHAHTPKSMCRVSALIFRWAQRTVNVAALTRTARRWLNHGVLLVSRQF